MLSGLMNTLRVLARPCPNRPPRRELTDGRAVLSRRLCRWILFVDPLFLDRFLDRLHRSFGAVLHDLPALLDGRGEIGDIDAVDVRLLGGHALFVADRSRRRDGPCDVASRAA